MKAAEIRSTFLKFFEDKGHTVVASSPVVPGDDPTLLFTNAGMNQFKDVFLGFDRRPYTRATTSQKCIRAGGKHNDLDNVGYTARHHTFFEMLGNFSFGDYFKQDAIAYAWELLTQVYKLPPEKLWVTVYAEDDEAYRIWHQEVGVPAERIVRIGDNKGARYASDNFWMMGDTGPCGPCTEIFYDHGLEVPGGPPGSADEDGDRYIEIWNNVFMQFNRDEAGVMHALPKPSVDTGMGLERLAAVLQHVHSNYEIDSFVSLINAAKRAVDDAGAENCDLASPSLKVIADHIRACAFTIADGVIPGNAGRGYVLRRIARRAIRHGYKLGARTPFFHALLPALVAEMGDAYPELRRDQARIAEVLKQEEEGFFRTIANGHGNPRQSHCWPRRPAVRPRSMATPLSSCTTPLVFRSISRPMSAASGASRWTRNASMNCWPSKKTRARDAGKFKMAQGLSYSGESTHFHGYDGLVREDAHVVAVYVDGTSVEQAEAGDDVIVVLDRTPFYAESGGQVGDVGELRNSTTRVSVEDTVKVQAAVYGHHGRVLEGRVKLGDVFTARVDADRRAMTVRNHSATHLMHKALREVLGAHVQQKGSLVTPERTRFDFAHTAPMTPAEIAKVEALVNAEILLNEAVNARVMPIDEARQSGAVMLFGEKYGETVRVLDIGTSREFCGGTHVARTGDIGLFKIVSESGVAAGIRRVEAITGGNALAYLQQLESTVQRLASSLKSSPQEVPGRLGQVLEQVRSLERELATVKGKLASSQGDELMTQAIDVNGIKVLAAVLQGADVKALRETMDKLKAKLKTAAIVLATVQDGKVQIAAGVTADSTGKVKAGELANFVAQQVGGKGGGKADLAMAGGTEPARLDSALASVQGWVAERA